jgi:nucleotide-binding universal stress UspA family protein
MSRVEKHPNITVGYDGSASARAALLWAVMEAEARGSALHVVIASQLGPITPWSLPPSHDWSVLEMHRAEEIAREAKEIAGGHARVTTAVHEGLPSRVLTRYSQRTDLLVVGSSGHVGLAGWVRGSVSRYLLHHAACPLVVVGPESFTGHVKRLVLSANLDPDGLAFPLVTSRVLLHHAPVHVIASYALPTLIPDIAVELELDLEEMHQNVREQVSTYVEDLRLALPSATPVTSELDQGLVMEVLDRQSRIGDLLVVPRGCEHDVPFAHGRCPVCVV